MHFGPSCLKYFSVNFIARYRLSRHSHLLKSDLYNVKNTFSSLVGSFPHKELHTLSRLHSALMPEEKNLQERSNDYESIFVLPDECFDDSNKTVLHRSNCSLTVIKLCETDENSDIFCDELSSNQHVKSIFSASLHNEAGLISLLTREHLLPEFRFDIFKCSCPSVDQLNSLMCMDNSIIFSSNENVLDKMSQKEEKRNKPSEEQLLSMKNCLCDSILDFFQKPLDPTIYHKDIIFHNNIRKFTTRGISAYVHQMYLIRVYGRFQYTKIKVEILKMTHHIEDGTVRVRWRASGLSRCKIFLLIGKLRNKKTWHTFFEEEAEWLDGFSVFSIGPDGLIYKHVCDKMIPDDELPIKDLSLKTKLLTLLRFPRRPSPTSMQAVLTYPVFSPSSPNCKTVGKKIRL